MLAIRRGAVPVLLTTTDCDGVTPPNTVLPNPSAVIVARITGAGAAMAVPLKFTVLVEAILLLSLAIF